MKIKKRKKHWKEKNTGRREGGKEGRKKKDASNQGILLRRKKLVRLKQKLLPVMWMKAPVPAQLAAPAWAGVQCILLSLNAPKTCLLRH